MELRRYRQDTSSGRYRLRDSRDQLVNFKVQNEDGKVRIIWDIDESLRRKFEITSNEPDLNPNLEDNVDDWAGAGLARSWDLAVGNGNVVRTAWPTSSVTNPTSLTAISQDPYPAYTQGASVQYFSVTHKCWLNAWVHPKFCPDKLGIASVSYNVQVARQVSIRSKVPLDMLRLPLEDGESVEVFCFLEKGLRGFWVPGMVAGQQHNGKTAPDYTIKLLNKTLNRVSADRVRRHFAPGGAVEVYRGSAKGWVPAMVKEQLGKVEYPAPLSQNSPDPQEREESSVMHAPHPWVNVFIVENMGNVGSVDHAVPLWLLRQPMAEPSEPGKGENSGMVSRFNRLVSSGKRT